MKFYISLRKFYRATRKFFGDRSIIMEFKNYSTESYLSGWEFLLCWDSKFYQASFAVGRLRQILEFKAVI